MRKLFVLSAIAVFTLPVAALAPSLAFAAFNDVTLTTDAVISVGGYTLNVSGSSATIQSIVVNSGSFSVTLAAGSAITISSPTLQQLSSDITSDVVTNPCTGSESSISLAYSGGGTVTNVITPSATVCTTPSSNSSGGGGGVGAGNNGPLGTPNRSVIPTTVFSKPVLHTNSPVSPSATSPSSLILAKNHQIWDRGEDIRALQKFFNTHGFIVATSGPGSPDNETTIFGTLTYKALVKFQKEQGLPQTGYLGPLTRAALASMSTTTAQ